MSSVLPAPFVVGAERSGTTLVRAVLDAHPSLSIPPESDFLVPLLRRRHHLESNGVLRADRLVAELSPPAGWGLDRGDVERAAAAAADLPDVVRRLQQARAGVHGAQRWGDKTPIHLTHLRLLADCFPEAVFVHVLRDPRDAVASLRDVEWGPDGLIAAATRWRRWVSRGRRQARHLRPQRYVEVRYEQLVADPTTVLRSLLRRLRLTWDPAVLDHATGADELLRTTPAALDHSSLRAPITAGLRDWRDDLPPGDVAVVETVVGRSLLDAGYAPSGHELPRWEAIGVRGRAGLARAEDTARRAAHGVRLASGAWRR